MVQHEVMPDRESWLARSTNTVEWLWIFGRLRPGIEPTRASAGMTTILLRLPTRLAAELNPAGHGLLRLVDILP